MVCNILKTSASFFTLRVSKHETSEEGWSELDPLHAGKMQHDTAQRAF